MSYLDREMQRAYQREWMRRRRRLWFAANGPCRECGSWDRLELDHIDPEKKVHHAIWSWSLQKRSAELAKCQVLCHGCHRAKTNADRRARVFAVLPVRRRRRTA